MAKIKELGEMKTQGLLTDEEFAAEKAKILASETKQLVPPQVGVDRSSGG